MHDRVKADSLRLYNISICEYPAFCSMDQLSKSPGSMDSVLSNEIASMRLLIRIFRPSARLYALPARCHSCRLQEARRLRHCPFPRRYPSLIAEESASHANSNRHSSRVQIELLLHPQILVRYQRPRKRCANRQHQHDHQRFPNRFYICVSQLIPPYCLKSPAYGRHNARAQVKSVLQFIPLSHYFPLSQFTRSSFLL